MDQSKNSIEGPREEEGGGFNFDIQHDNDEGDRHFEE